MKNAPMRRALIVIRKRSDIQYPVLLPQIVYGGLEEHPDRWLSVG